MNSVRLLCDMGAEELEKKGRKMPYGDMVDQDEVQLSGLQTVR